MALVRHEVQQYPNPAALAAETVVPTNNDEAHIESLNRRFNWLEGSQAVADNKYVIDQTSQTANGRWAATAVEGAKVFTGTGNTGVIPNGNTSVFTVALADGASSVLATTSGAALGITNGGAFPTNVFLDSIVLTADNTAQVTVRNESGLDVASFTVAVKAIDYTGVAAAAPYARKILIADLVKTGDPSYVSDASAFVVGDTYIANLGGADDLSNIGYTAANVPFIVTGTTATAYTPGTSAAYNITTATLSVTELRDDFAVTLSPAYETDTAGNIQSAIGLSQPLLGQTDVIWGACSYNAIKMTASKLGLNGSDRFFIEQVI